MEAADEATASPLVNREEQEIVRKKILDNQYKCFEKMNRDLPYNKSGSGDISCERRRCFTKFSLLMIFFSFFLWMFQVCTAAVTGTAGCVGTIPRREPTPLRTAPITLSTLTPQVSSLLLGIQEPNVYTFENSDSQACLFILEKATKYCGEDGQWFRHPDTNRTWSNYTLCNENTSAKLKVGHER